MTDKPSYFRLFANCVLVKGHSRSTICDLQSGEIHFVPNDLLELLNTYQNQPLAKVKEDYDAVDHHTIDEYYRFLVDNQLGMFYYSEELALFPNLNLAFQSPAVIHNAILDVGEDQFDYTNVIAELSMLGCAAVQVRIFTVASLVSLESLLKKFQQSRIKSIELFVRYCPELRYQAVNELITRHSRITNVVIHTAPTVSAQCAEADPQVSVTFTREEIRDETHCGFIDPAYFSINISHFAEALVANTCLNKKIAVDRWGFIKNCPAMSASFGHITHTSLLSVVSDPMFTNAWAIHKDQITVCMDCEFRYVCSDCRALLSEPQDMLSKPQRCGYNPYTAEWHND